jgi:hypothetical protein
MAKKSRATFQKREKERARQQKQHDKAQRRLEAKARRDAGEPSMEDDELETVGVHPGPHAVPPQGDDAHPVD